MAKFKNARAAIRDFLSKSTSTASSIGRHGGTFDIASLPSEYDDTPYDTIVDGHRVKTVGEYKDAISKYYG